MRFYSETLGLPDSAFTLLRGLIHDRIGLFYEDGKRDILADKLSPLVLEAGFDSFLDYYYLLKYDQSAGQEWERVMNTLSVQETYFWREMDQIRSLTETLLPEYARNHPLEKIRIWSAACASGEEPLTIAMALEEAGWFNRRRIEILASDASPLALEKAQAGFYRERSFRNLSEELKAGYFLEEGGGWRVSRTLQGRIHWSLANLVSESQIALLSRSPFIFCRNVFIYFSSKTITKTVEVFHRYMPTPGYLFVGASESLLKSTTLFELDEIGGAFVYVKK